MDIPVRYGTNIKEKLEEKLRVCQKVALENLVVWFVNAETTTKTAVVVMPTGSGKTGVICSLPYWFGDAVSREQLDIDLTLPILVIAPGLDILNQLESNFKNHKESPSFLVRIGVIANEQKKLRQTHYTAQVIQKTREVGDLESCLMNIVLSNAQKWRGNREDADWRDLPSDLFSIVIVDEAHHLPADQWRYIVEKFQPHSKVVFFTATPYRADGRSITTDGAINVHGFAYHLKEDDAVKQKIIRPTRFTELEFDVGQIHHKYNETEPHIHFTYVTKVVREVVQQLRTRDQRFPLPAPYRHCAMLIASDKSQADRVAQICHEHGMGDQEAVTIHSTSSRRDDFREDLLAGRIRILVVVQMLLEGFDHPPVSIAGIVTRIGSAPKFAQFIGRARRVISGEENIEALIITHKYFEQRRMYDEFQRGYLIPPQ